MALQGASALVVGCGGVGSAIAASLAASGVVRVALFDRDASAEEALAGRLRAHYPAVAVSPGSNDPAGFDLLVNAPAVGMNPGDPLPLDPERLTPHMLVGEVVMANEVTAFLAAAQARGCRVQGGTDLLVEMIPPYLEIFGSDDERPSVGAIARL